MEFLQPMINGLWSMLDPTTLFYCFMGVFLGTLVGVLPGIGPVGAMSILLPVTLNIPPLSTFVLLAGIYYGSKYGGSTTSILVNVPGEAASVVTCLDGYQMAKNGQAGPALGISAIGSFIAGILGTLGIAVLAVPIVSFALKYGPAEYFSMMILGMTLLVFLSSTSVMRALMMACVGLLIGTIGLDPIAGVLRFTMGIPELMDGVGLIPLAMGLYGIGEILTNVEQKIRRQISLSSKVGRVLPSWEDHKKSFGAILRGTVVGFFTGILPGGGATIASFASYAIEKRISRHPEKFGKGAIEGVASPESSNNAATQSAFIPMLTLGIPSNAGMAVLLGALIIHGFTPGPLLLSQHPDTFWALVASMFLGNLMLLILNLPLIGIWIQVLKIPFRILIPIIVVMCVVGAYSVNNSVTDIFVMLFFGIVGYLMKKLSLDAAPLILAFVLGPIMENSFRQALILSSGSIKIFFVRPISLSMLIIALLLLVLPPLIPALRERREKMIQEKEEES